MKRTTLSIALASAFSLSAFAGGYGQHSGAQSSQNDPSSTSSTFQEGASSAQSQSPDVVKQVQQKLSEKGQNPGQPNGQMTPKTQAALSQFQQQNGLQPTGQIDQQTLAALDIEQSSASGGTASPSETSGGVSGASK